MEPWCLLERSQALGTDPAGLEEFPQHQGLHPASRIVQVSHYGASTPSSVKIFHCCSTWRTWLCLSQISSSKLAHCFSPFIERMKIIFLGLFFNSGTFNIFKHLNLHSAFPCCCCFPSQVMLDPLKSCLHFPQVTQAPLFGRAVPQCGHSTLLNPHQHLGEQKGVSHILQPGFCIPQFCFFPLSPCFQLHCNGQGLVVFF